MSDNSGILIVVEGPEGAGKTTQVVKLIEKMENAGRTVKTWREPGGTLLGEYIRGMLKTNDAGEAPVPAAELFLFEAARAQLVEKCIRPALRAGHDVVLDRFYDSTTAYQGYGRGFNTIELYNLHMMATSGLEPDISILLDLEPEVGIKRAQKRNNGFDRFDDEAIEFHRKVTDGYREIANERSNRLWYIIDANNSIEEVEDAVWGVIRHHLLHILLWHETR